MSRAARRRAPRRGSRTRAAGPPSAGRRRRAVPRPVRPRWWGRCS
jgi:hypothetical protein